MRYFNSSGPNVIEQHYTLMRSELVKKGLAKVHKERYFTIPTKDGTGKSTYFQLLTYQLEAEGYKVAHVNLENYIKMPRLILSWMNWWYVCAIFGELTLLGTLYKAFLPKLVI